MKKLSLTRVLMLTFLLSNCQQRTAGPSDEAIRQMDLKTGKVISCGPPGTEFGSAEFRTSCSENVREDFNLAIKLLHSFEYDEAEKAFAKVIERAPDCAMAYWGVAMANYHPLWTPPTEAELKKGEKAIGIAQSLQPSGREAAYINAIAAFFNNWQTTDHRTRCLAFEKAMEGVFRDYPEDKEATLFYALALNAAVDPADKSFSRQKKAGDLLNALYPDHPNHPGVAHYLIHTYDFPEIAHLGLPAARQYASVAPSSAHALHMPSHIFTRLGLWDECIRSNLVSVASAKCYAEQTGMKGHWDEELHGLDYLVYAYLQKGENDSAKMQWDYLNTIRDVFPLNFKVAYAYAAIPSRYLLENKMWREAAALQVAPVNFPWQDFPWQEAIIHFTRLMGAVHTDNAGLAKNELQALSRLHQKLVEGKDSYKANQVAIQVKAGEAWILLGEGKKDEALALMQVAADMEDRTEKHPVTPGEVIPARQLLADMFMQLEKPAEALAAYEADLKRHPNRFNALYGAGLAAEKSGNLEKSRLYFRQLQDSVASPNADRIELTRARQARQ